MDTRNVARQRSRYNVKAGWLEAQGLSTAFTELVGSEFTERLALRLLSG